jgi:hypothetical protein
VVGSFASETVSFYVKIFFVAVLLPAIPHDAALVWVFDFSDLKKNNNNNNNKK